MISTFALARIQRLRKQAAEAASSDTEPAEGWSISSVDPMGVMAVFKPLRMRSGFVIRAYQFNEGGNGNAFVWAVPISVPFSDPADCPRLEGVFLAPPKPSAALRGGGQITGGPANFNAKDRQAFANQLDRWLTAAKE